MDEEDLAELEESRQLKTESTFAGLGSTAEEITRKDALMDLFRPTGDDTIGVKLLQKMGWKKGQGIGRMVKRKAKLSDGREEKGELHLFAPANSKMISFVRKDDYQGLDFAGEKKLEKPQATASRDDEEDDSSILARSKAKFSKAKAKPKTSFGVGILNDTGSDDEDPYDMGPKINIKRSIRADNEETTVVVKPKIKKLSANPAITARPTFKSTSNLLKQSTARLRKCHDGKLALQGFILSTKSRDAMPVAHYPPPTIPTGWKSGKSSESTTSAAAKESWQSSSDAAKASKLNPSARGAILGEEALKGKSVFDYLTPEQREKMVAATGRTDLPEAKGETPPNLHPKLDTEQLWELVPALDKTIALQALQRDNSGWMPYAEDEAKRNRYVGFLALRAGLTEKLPERAKGVKDEEWAKEMREFVHSAQMYRPLEGLLKSKFHSAKRTYAGGKNEEKEGEARKEIQDPAEQAARLGLYGPLTRSVKQFYPTRLLCKRFGVETPAHVTAGAGIEGGERKVEQPVSERVMEKMRWFGRPNRSMVGSSGSSEGMSGVEMEIPGGRTMRTVNPERNEAIEGKRASDQTFKAVFGDDES